MRGFTLLELLVTMAILAVLVIVGVTGISAMIEHGNMAREISAAKSLISAYQLYASDHDGRLLPAVDKSAGTKANPVWFQPSRRNITFMEAPHRYPFRLAPYFDYQLKGTILLNGAEKQIAKIFGKSGNMYDYGVSLCPAFGLNYRFCGGYVEPTGELDYPSTIEAITRQSQAERNIIVFASAGGSPDETLNIKGYFKVDAPTSPSGRWNSRGWQHGDNPGDYGSVDPRYKDKAVCVFLQGNVELKSIEDLRDMRLWSATAAQQDDANYVPIQ